MPDLRWVEGDVGCTDLVDETARIVGYFCGIANGWRGYAVDWRAGRPWSFSAIADRPTEAAARAWVEDRVREGGADV